MRLTGPANLSPAGQPERLDLVRVDLPERFAEVLEYHGDSSVLTPTLELIVLSCEVVHRGLTLVPSPGQIDHYSVDARSPVIEELLLHFLERFVRPHDLADHGNVPVQREAPGSIGLPAHTRHPHLT